MTEAERRKIKQQISELELLQAESLTKRRSLIAVNNIHNRITRLYKLLGGERFNNNEVVKQYAK